MRKRAQGFITYGFRCLTVVFILFSLYGCQQLELRDHGVMQVQQCDEFYFVDAHSQLPFKHLKSNPIRETVVTAMTRVARMLYRNKKRTAAVSRMPCPTLTQALVTLAQAEK